MAYWITNTNFNPFHDEAFYYGKTNIISGVSNSINTKNIDNYREGINVRNISDIYNSTQVKISFLDSYQDFSKNLNGNLSHESSFVTLGQATDISQFTNERIFRDSISGVEGNFLLNENLKCSRTVEYLLNNKLLAEGYIDYDNVYPIYMNGGPQFAEEAIIEPFPIPNRLQTNESVQELARGIFAFLESGNSGDERRFGSNQNEQLIYREQPKVVRPYLEYGANVHIITSSLGTVIKTIQSRPSAIFNQDVVQKINPWLDEPKNNYFPKFTNTLNLLSASIIINNSTTEYFNLNYGTNDTEIQSREQKSSAAGYTVYGPNVGFYGTDSIAFANKLRGS